MIKLITIDLDNTLLNKEKKITEYNKKIIALARQKGVHIVIASGRPIDGIKPILKELNMNTRDDYVICYNGSKIYNLYNDKCIYSSYIKGKDIKEVYELSQKFKFFFHAFKSDGTLICPYYNHYTDIEATINKIKCEILSIDEINDDDQFIKAMIVDSKENIDYAFKNVPKEFLNKYNVVRSSNIFLEFLNKNNDKGNALEYLANYLNINMSDTMAIGDASNDLGMIKRAKIGVAMSNSFKEVLDEAQFITKSCEDDGVGYAINKYLKLE